MIAQTSRTSSLWVDITRWGNRRLSATATLRRVGIAGYRTALSLNRFLPPPRMLVNGHSKSGTHLLSDCIALLPKTMFSGRHFTLGQFLSDEPFWRSSFSVANPAPAFDRDRLHRFLARCPNGMFVTAHVRQHPELDRILDDLGFRTLLLLRDPRDVVVSQVKFMLRERGHFQHRYFAEVLRNDDERFMAAIVGGQPERGQGVPFPSIGESYQGYLGWCDRPSTLVTRFDVLVGPSGGGDGDAQIAEIGRIAAFVGRPIAAQAAERIAHRMYSTKSFTFRKGEIGDWRNHFSDEHVAAFKEVAGGLLVQLGYERDLDW